MNQDPSIRILAIATTLRRWWCPPWQRRRLGAELLALAAPVRTMRVTIDEMHREAIESAGPQPRLVFNSERCALVWDFSEGGR